MTIINARNHCKIAENAKLAESFFDQLLGLINPQNPRSLVFYTRFGIHTFFLHDKIDVLVLNKVNEVKAIRENLAPFNLFFYNPQLSIVVELPRGTIKKCAIRLNDKILFT